MALLQDTEILDHLWYNSNIHPYINAFKSLGLAARLIEQAESLPFFEISYKASILKINVLSSGLPKYAIMNHNDFNNIFNSYTHFYTDASVWKQPDSVGFGIYDPSLSLKLSGKLPDHWSICTGEMYAIGRAVEEIIERRVKLSILKLILLVQLTN
ncbi:hypothetical protein HHI36_002081 [Cryptolaemus montrouzieri]|uniref:Uncharacterized protein n=1 Tax=Cryptolaemus montrouzieri TaxID=559131 RepID=A0ABD2PA39_9CUCU